MKDALGHGSDKRGTANASNAGNHQTGVLRIGRPPGTAKVQELSQGPAPNAQQVGNPLWQTTKVVGPSSQTGRKMLGGKYRQPNTRAEHVAQMKRIDNSDAVVRVR